MRVLDRLREEWREFSIYERFEQLIARVLLFVISIIIIYALILAGTDIMKDFRTGAEFLDAEALKDTFGSLLTVLILMEFNHSIALSLRQRTGVVQVRVVVLIAILVIVRKLILLDYKSANLDTLVGFGGMCLSLGILYWLLADGDRRQRSRVPPDT